MDWIGGRLSALIAEGQKALGREIVVAAEAAEDQMDDGMDPDAWVEEYPNDGPSISISRRSRSRTGSVRRSHRNSHTPLPIQTSFDTRSRSDSTSASTAGSPRASRFEHGHGMAMGAAMPGPGGSLHGPSTDSLRIPTSPTLSNSFKEDESAWESPELRESMSRARARLLAARVRG